MPETLPQLSVIVPCRNEGKWIRACLQCIVDNDYPPERMEVLVVDGMSSDDTRAIVAEFAASHAAVRLLDNPRRITPTALNLGIAAARGDVIIRMDAHVEYPADYISALVKLLAESGADNVGGLCITRPDGPSARSRAIAIGMSHPLGVGNSYFRIGLSEPRWVDTVPFGCYRREVFARIGCFDEELVRNQDDEFNLRLLKQGGRILLTPRVVSYYYTRDSLAKLWRMYYQYGYFKPLVVRKVKGVMTLRQLGPPTFVLALLGGCLAAPWHWLAAAGLATLLGTYFLAIACGAAGVARKQGLAPALWLFAVLPVIHCSYGLGYLRGIVEFLILRRRLAGNTAQIPISR